MPKTAIAATRFSFRSLWRLPSLEPQQLLQLLLFVPAVDLPITGRPLQQPSIMVLPLRHPRITVLPLHHPPIMVLPIRRPPIQATRHMATGHGFVDITTSMGYGCLDTGAIHVSRFSQIAWQAPVIASS